MSFYFPYVGNKEKEMKFIIQNLPESFDTVVEPFGGSLALSRVLYNEGRRVKYIFGDVDKDLINLCNTLHVDVEKNLTEIENEVNGVNSKDDYNKIEKYRYLIRNGWYNYRPGLFDECMLKRKENFLKRLREKSYKCNKFFSENKYELRSYKETLEIATHEENALIFIDPPYVNSKGNGSYSTDYVDWEFLYEYVNKSKNKIMLVVNGDIFMRLLFKNFRCVEYQKTYGFSAHKAKHCIFTNY